MTVDLALPAGSWTRVTVTRHSGASVACTAEDVALLHQQHFGPICRIVAPIVGDYGSAEETVQDAFVILHRNRDRVEFETAFPYVRRIAINEALDRATRRTKEIGLVDRATRQGFLPGEDLPRHRSTTLDRTVDSWHVRDLVAALPPDQRAVIVLHHYCDWPDEQIAEELGVLAVTVRSRLRRARQTLKKQLERGE